MGSHFPMVRPGVIWALHGSCAATAYHRCVAGEAELDSVVRDRLQAYARRAHLLRQIHSNKGSRAQRWNRYYLVASVVVATVVSVIGFMGTADLASSVSRLTPVSRATIEDLYNLAVLAILVVTLLGLIYRFDERSNRHYRSIEALTEFIRDVEDQVALSAAHGRLLDEDQLTSARERYKGILATLPPSTDREYLRAKTAAADKKKKAAEAESVGPLPRLQWIDTSAATLVTGEAGNRLAHAMADPLRQRVLTTVRDALDVDAWVTGGFVRESVWDQLHGYAIPTPADDVDIIYFAPDRATKADEHALEERLARVSPNVNWSVKNQARMHVVSNDEPYVSLEDAVSHYPETATAVACRIDTSGKLRILAPHGLDDLVSLKVRKTPDFDPSRYQARIREKAWREKWPDLQFHD
jgi:hypothetical protein